MDEIQEIKQNAQAYRKQERYNDAVDLYRELWTEYRERCNEWEGWGYATCLRKLGKSEEALEICRTVYQTKREFKAGKDLYAWCIYDTEIKKDNEQIKKDEEKFYKAVSAIQNLTTQDQYSPHAKTIFRVIDYLIQTKQIYPAKAILGWTDKLDQNTLSDEPYRFIGADGKHREVQSEKEKWFAIKTKSLEKLGRYKECSKICKEALTTISNFHYSNDVWFERRIALSKAHLGDKQKAAEALEKILQRKKEWFIQHEIAIIYYDLGDNEKALNYAIDAALNFGKNENKWELFLLMAQILITQGRINDAKEHLIFAAKLRVKQEWKIPEKLDKMLTEYKIDISISNKRSELLKKLRLLWEAEKYSSLPSMDGTVKTILKNGKAGFISGENGKDYYFKTNSFKGNKNRLERGLKVSFFIEDSFDKKKKINTEAATHVKERNSEQDG